MNECTCVCALVCVSVYVGIHTFVYANEEFPEVKIRHLITSPLRFKTEYLTEAGVHKFVYTFWPGCHRCIPVSSSPVLELQVCCGYRCAGITGVPGLQVYQCYRYARVTDVPVFRYARIIDVPGLQVCQGYRYARITGVPGL